MGRSGDDSPTFGTGSDRLSPSSARRRLGDELRSVRESTGLTLSEAAAAIQRSAATLSRLEKGRSMPRLVDVRALLDHYARQEPQAVLDGTRDRVFSLADVGRKDEWYRSFRDVISSDMISDDIPQYLGLESDAEKIRSFEPELIPGLLQTSAYAAAVTRLFFPKHTQAKRDRFVELRLARQRALRRPGAALVFDVVIGEAAFRRVIGSRTIMHDQVQTILGFMRDDPSTVRVRVAPIALTIPAVVGGPFVIMEFLDEDEPGLVYVESRTGAQYVQSTRALLYYQDLFNDLSAAALDADRSRTMLQDVLELLA